MASLKIDFGYKFTVWFYLLKAMPFLYRIFNQRTVIVKYKINNIKSGVIRLNEIK